MSPPCELHSADTALQALILHSLHVRLSVERESCLASFAVGGLQLTSVVESAVAAVARDLVDLLNGTEQASVVAWDFLRHAMA